MVPDYAGINFLIANFCPKRYVCLQNFICNSLKSTANYAKTPLVSIMNRHPKLAKHHKVVPESSFCKTIIRKLSGDDEFILDLGSGLVKPGSTVHYVLSFFKFFLLVVNEYFRVEYWILDQVIFGPDP